MNHFVKTVVFTLSSALVATSAFAAPQPHADRHAATHPHQLNSKFEQKKYHAAPQQHMVKKSDHPQRDWKVNHTLPSKFHAKQYRVDYKQSKKLTPPGRNQQWVKVNGDYVLMNTVNYKVIKVVG